MTGQMTDRHGQGPLRAELVFAFRRTIAASLAPSTNAEDAVHQRAKAILRDPPDHAVRRSKTEWCGIVGRCRRGVGLSTHVGGLAEPERGLNGILRHSPAIAIHYGQAVLRAGVPLRGGLAV